MTFVDFVFFIFDLSTSKLDFNWTKVATFSTNRWYRLFCASYFSEIFNKRSSDISGTCISLVCCFLKKKICRNTYLKLRIRALFIIVECSQDIQFVYTEVYSIYTTGGEGNCINLSSLAHYNFFYNFTFSFKGLFSIFFLFCLLSFHVVSWSCSDQEFSQIFSIATWFGPLTIA